MSDTEPLDTAAITAAELDGRQYPLRPSAEEQQRWKDAGLFVIVSDDSVRVYGVDSHDIGSGARPVFMIGRGGVVPEISELAGRLAGENDETTKLAVRDWVRTRFGGSVKITARWWAKPTRESWLITAPGDIGHHFDLMAGVQVFCRALVLSVDDLPGAKP